MKNMISRIGLIKLAPNEEGIRELKKEGFRSPTVRLPTVFIRSATLCLPLKALLFFISFNLSVIGILDCLLEFRLMGFAYYLIKHLKKPSNLSRQGVPAST